VNPQDPKEALRARMDDLATGQLSPLAAWRLRRRIAADPDLSREWEDIRQLRQDLRYLVREQQALQPARPVAPQSSVPIYRLGGITMKRRTVLAATAASLLLMTGAFAAHRWLDTSAAFSFTDANHRNWTIHTGIAGKIHFIDAQGQDSPSELVSEGGFPASDTVRLACNTKGIDVTLHGYGRHAIRSANGDLIGYLEVSPLSTDDQQRLREQGEKSQKGIGAMYTQPEVFTSSNDIGESGMNTSPGLAAGFYQHPGVSWKVLGYAQVTAVCLVDGRQNRQQGTADVAPSLDTLSPQVPAPIREALTRLVSLAPPRNAPPRIFWQIADTADHSVVGGRWRTIARSGSFTGYGRHEVEDEKGKTLLTLDVSPLTSSPSQK